MNNSYINYIRNRDPIKFIFNIFRNYKKSCDILQEKQNSVKRNQSAPAVARQEISVENGMEGHQKTEDIQHEKPRVIESSSSRDSLKVTWSNANFGKNTSYLNVTRKKKLLDTSIQEKLEEYPVPETIQEPIINVRPMYPWQNYNIDSLQLNTKFNKMKSVSDLSSQMLRMKKSILKKASETKSAKKSPPREVTFKKTASMLVYPKFKFNVMRQPSLNLSTGNKAEIPAKRKWDDCPGYRCQHYQHRPVYPSKKRSSGTEACRRYTHGDQAYSFPYFDNKKQKIH